jgi:hypothetical protein
MFMKSKELSVRILECYRREGSYRLEVRIYGLGSRS